MWTRRFMIVGLVAFLVVFGWAAQQTQAASAGPTFTLDWYTMDSGGGTSAGPTFAVSGTMGQPDAGSHTGPSFQVDGGFWNAWFKLHGIQLPVIFKD